MEANQSTRLTLETFASVEFQLVNISSYVGYVIFQAHSQHTVLNVSLPTAPWKPGSSTSGVNIGLLTLLKPGDTSAIWYLNTSVNQTVNILVAAFTNNSTGKPRAYVTK